MMLKLVMANLIKREKELGKNFLKTRGMSEV